MSRFTPWRRKTLMREVRWHKPERPPKEGPAVQRPRDVTVTMTRINAWYILIYLDISWYILIYLDIIIFDNDKNGKTLIMLIHADSCWSFHRDSVIAPEFLRCQAKARSLWTFCCPVQRLGWPYRAAAANTRITAEFPEFRDDARHTGVPGVSNRFKTFFFNDFLITIEVSEDGSSDPVTQWPSDAMRFSSAQYAGLRFPPVAMPEWFLEITDQAMHPVTLAVVHIKIILICVFYGFSMFCLFFLQCFPMSFSPLGTTFGRTHLTRLGPSDCR